MLAKDLLQKRVREEENVRMSNTTLHNTRFIHLQQKLSYNWIIYLIFMMIFWKERNV